MIIYFKYYLINNVYFKAAEESNNSKIFYLIQKLLEVIMVFLKPESRQLAISDYADDAPMSRMNMLNFVPEQVRGDVQKIAKGIKEVLFAMLNQDMLSNTPIIKKAVELLNSLSSEPVKRNDNPVKDLMKLRRKNCG